eukprot:CAMPEP_0116146100 /NCGR_PEP_ID=MMETSP0329-20121206/16980_1 /TAXON_ID=697910 /ORGANISM="Pseudo-nitzschia arenysensis, Strain B593" /LENGTH=232 /DNA_ID=CAMNT_0003641817 /DNA_START=73 /DNA_END=771 /DNA_ORIENTATION=+
MKFRALLFITLLANLSMGNAQKDDKEEEDDMIITLSPLESPDDPDITLSPIETVDTSSLVPSEPPVEVTTSSPTGSPTTELPTGAPSPISEPTSNPEPFTGTPSAGPSDMTPSTAPFSSLRPSFLMSPSSFPLSTEVPSDSPSALATSRAPIIVEPSAPPVPFEDCAGQVCDITDSEACSCRVGLECRQRGFDTFLCSQISRKERSRLSDTEGIGGAAGRDNRGRSRAEIFG